MEKKQKSTRCEECAYYDYDDESDTYSCMINLDEDDFSRFIGSDEHFCPYYKFYDEYKTVQRQN